MQKVLGAAMVSAVIVATMIVGTVQAKGRLTTTISLESNSRLAADSVSVVSFRVTRSYAYDSDTIWVTNKCFDDAGNLVSKVDRAVQWGMWYSLEGTAGPFETAGTSCMAYTTLRPWQDRVGDAVVYYTP